MQLHWFSPKIDPYSRKQLSTEIEELLKVKHCKNNLIQFYSMTYINQPESVQTYFTIKIYFEISYLVILCTAVCTFTERQPQATKSCSAERILNAGKRSLSEEKNVL